MIRSESLVLAIEDGPAVLRFIRRTLDGNDLAVPDLIVLDIGIPMMDGLEVCRRIKAHDYTPVILVTARDADEDIVTGFEVGA